jgi:peptidyl-prolyl cis-trans isomerase B (cyclophilin B)
VDVRRKKTVALVLGALVTAALIAGCGGGDAKGSEVDVFATGTAQARPDGGGSTPAATTAPTTPVPTETAGPAPEYGPLLATCGERMEGESMSTIADIQRDNQRSFSSAPATVIDKAKTYVAQFETSKGPITVELATADAPNTVNNFVFLACHGFYDGLKFHRVITEPPFMIQGGDPLGNGTGGPGYKFADEFSQNRKHDTGVISMANAGPGTNGSQFFITLAPQPHLDGRHSVFGKVTAGMETVRAIRQGDTITSIQIEEH